MIAPTLLVGLGGTGSKIVTALTSIWIMQQTVFIHSLSDR